MSCYQQILAYFAFASTIAACSHPLEVNGRGEIISESGSRNCSYQEQPCENLVTGAYSETYTTRASPGWHFSHWSNYCSDSTEECSFEFNASTVRKNWSRTMPPLVANFEQFASEGTVILDDRVINADVTLSHLDSFDTPLCSGTSDSNGRLDFEVACFEQEGLYVLKTDNGYDREKNDSSMPVEGSMLAILPRQQLETGWAINPLSQTAALLMQQQILMQIDASETELFWKQYQAVSKLMIPRSYFGLYSPSINGVELGSPMIEFWGAAEMFGWKEGFYPAAREAIQNGEPINTISPLREILTNNVLDLEQPVIRATFESEGRDLQLTGDVLSVVTDNGINLYRVAEDSALKLDSVIQLDSIRFVSMQGDRLAIAQDLNAGTYPVIANRIVVYDISDTRSPRMIGQIAEDNVRGLLVEGHSVFAHTQAGTSLEQAEILLIDAPETNLPRVAERVNAASCGGCASVLQINNGVLYLLQRLIGGDGGPLITNIQTFDIRDRTELTLLGTLPDIQHSRPDYLVFAGDYAWLKAWNPDLERKGDTWLLNWPGSPAIRLMDLRDPSDLKEIDLPAPPDLDILSRDIAVLDRKLITLDAHVIRAYAYPEPNSASNEHPLAYLNPLHQTYFEMKLRGSTAFLLGDGHIATRELPF